METHEIAGVNLGLTCRAPRAMVGHVKHVGDGPTERFGARGDVSRFGF